MKKLLFIFSLLFTVHCSLISVFAINPIIIKKSNFGAPPSNAKLSDDSNYYPNDIGLTCKGTYDISETFQPKETTTTDANGNKVSSFIPYTITEIKGMPPVFSKKQWTNPGALHLDLAYDNNPKVIFGNIDTVKKAFLSYNPDSSYGSFGTGNKSMSNQMLRCLRGQRLVKAVRLANGIEGGSYSNEQIAWDNGGKYDPVSDTTQDTGKKVQLDDIAISLNKDPYLSLTETTPDGKAIRGTVPTYLFYDPEANCNLAGTDDPAAPIPSSLDSFAPAGSPSYDRIPPEDAIALYKTIGPSGSGPSRRNVKTCSENKDGSLFDCETKKTSMPRGELYPTTLSVNRQFIPAAQDVPVKDLCQTNPEQTITDRPNKVEFSIKAFAGFVEEITDAIKTISHPLQYEYKMDANIQDGLSVDETAMKNILPQSAIDDSCVSDTSQGPSSTDGKSFDPGNDCTRKTVAKWLLPKSEQRL